MNLPSLTVEQLTVFLSYFPTLKLRFYFNTGTYYAPFEVDAPKLLNHFKRLQGTIALMTAEGIKQPTAQHSLRYVLDVSGISTLELEWVCAALKRRTANLTAVHTRKLSNDRQSTLDHGDCSQWSYWQGKRFAMAPVQLRHAVLSQHDHGQPDHHGRQHVEKPRQTATRPAQHRRYPVVEPSN